MAQQSAATARRAIGAMFFTIFGAIWFVIWSQRAFGLQPGILVLIAAGAMVILTLALRQYHQHRTAHDSEADSPAGKRASRIFNIVNVTQWVGILVVGNVLANLGMKDWVLPSAIFIIGIHFFPLAKAFGNSQLVATGAAMVMLAIAYPWVAPGGAGNPVGCLGAGIILWASAIRSLAGKPSNHLEVAV